MNLGGVVCIFQAVGSDYRVNKKIKDKDEVQGPLSLGPLNTGAAGYMRGGPGALLRTLLPHAVSCCSVCRGQVSDVHPSCLHSRPLPMEASASHS